MSGSAESHMTRHEFVAVALAEDLDVNRIGAGLGISRKYRWEDAMALNYRTLKPSTEQSPVEQEVFLYSFGAVVFVDCSPEEVQGFFAQLADKVTELPLGKYHDTYSLRIAEGETLSITNDYAVMPRYDRVFVDIIASVIAKSVALERIEEHVDTVLDDAENLIAFLDSGKLGITDRRLAKMVSSILKFKFHSIASVMVLDKPDVTWDNPAADNLYLTMANLFELEQRYFEIKHKSETLLDITQVFTSLSHAKRSTRLEVIIIVLIAIEIIIYLFEILR